MRSKCAKLVVLASLMVELERNVSSFVNRGWKQFLEINLSFPLIVAESKIRSDWSDMCNFNVKFLSD